jgi:hypothetical protein
LLPAGLKVVAGGIVGLVSAVGGVVEVVGVIDVVGAVGVGGLVSGGAVGFVVGFVSVAGGTVVGIVCGTVGLVCGTVVVGAAVVTVGKEVTGAVVELGTVAGVTIDCALIGFVPWADGNSNGVVVVVGLVDCAPFESETLPPAG